MSWDIPPTWQVYSLVRCHCHHKHDKNIIQGPSHDACMQLQARETEKPEVKGA